MERSPETHAILGIKPEGSGHAENGYLRILDTNSIYFDYDADVDDLWLDLPLVRRLPSRPRRREPATAKAKPLRRRICFYGIKSQSHQ